MALIQQTVVADEKTWQTNFYDAVFGPEKDEFLTVDRSTDGYTRGILFEHKQNVTSNGRSKTLSQAIIYLCRFNRDGVPVPSKIALVSQDEGKIYVYDTQDYISYIEDIENNSNLKASDGINGFQAAPAKRIIEFDKNLNPRGLVDAMNFVSEAPKTVKIHINVHNVYGWSGYYYNNASNFKQKPEKKAFFNELRNPVGTLKDCIEPWTGNEMDFKYIMDMLNDPMTQKKLGAFYTPPEYSKLAVELVKKAIKRAVAAGKKDYIIFDRCAGTGNLEMFLDDGDEDILSHVIVSTYELKEWIVLKDRFGGRVRYIIPPIPAERNQLPELNDEGFLFGANALTKDIIDNIEVKKYVDDDDCAIILFENPPYVETTGVEFQRKKEESNDWKNSYVVEQMKQEVSGPVSNDIANVFIWSAFKYFLRQDTDSYIVFSPIKYWKVQNLINKKFYGGYAFNRQYFHAKMPACVTCCMWSNEDVKPNSQEIIALKAVNLDSNGKYIDEGEIKARKVHFFYSEYYYDKRKFDDDTDDGVLIGLNGLEQVKGKLRNKPIYNDNILGYCVANTSGFDNPDLNSSLLVAGRYDGNGFYLRADNFWEKLPTYAASRYYSYNNDWKIRSMTMKSADKHDEYTAALKNGKLNAFLCQTLLWTCTTQSSHIRCFRGSDGRLYKNQLCLDGDTLGKRKIDDFVANGYVFTEGDKTLCDKMNEILNFIKKECTDEYNPDYTYGLYQIDEEINIKIKIGTKSDGTDKIDYKYGDLNNMIKEIKILIKQYYLNNLVDTLFEYQFLK